MHEQTHSLQHLFCGPNTYHILHSILPEELLKDLMNNQNKFPDILCNEEVVYVSKFEEMQSALMSTLAWGHRMGWQSMPKTRLELWAALYNFGICLPDELYNELIPNTADWEEAQLRFPVRTEDTQNQNKANLLILYDLVNILPGVAQPIFEQVFPALYGVGLTYIGDRYGLARMERCAVDNSIRDQIVDVMLPHGAPDTIQLADILNADWITLDPDTLAISGAIEFSGHQFLNNVGKHLYGHPLLEHDFKIVTNNFQRTFWKPHLSALHDAGFTDAPASPTA